MIKVNGLSKHFGSFKALDSLSLHVPKGTIYGLVGPNGAGKTTVISHLSACSKPESGEVMIDGESIYENEALKSRVLCISDDWFHFSTYNIRQMAQFYADMYPNFSRGRYERLKEVFKIDEKTQIRRLSKGQKKQVAFWLSISAMPEVLILDEPLDGLDPVMRRQVLNLVIADVADRELTVLVSSHNLRELEDICDWVGIIHEGKLITEKPLSDIKGSVCKYQLAFSEDEDEFLSGLEGLMHMSKTGSVYTVIIKSGTGGAEDRIREKNPLLMDRISLSLEEVFIYELGGLGYDFENIIF